eukprot:5514175-Pyramimonas_sp.AAC.1
MVHVYNMREGPLLLPRVRSAVVRLNESTDVLSRRSPPSPPARPTRARRGPAARTAPPPPPRAAPPACWPARGGF